MRVFVLTSFFKIKAMKLIAENHLKKMAVAGATTVQEVDLWINDGLFYKEISELLQLRFPDLKGLSVRSIRRFCSDNNIGKKCTMSKQDLSKKVFEMQSKVFLLTKHTGHTAL